MSQSKGNSRTLLRYLAYAKPYRIKIAVVILAGIAKFTLPLIQAVASRKIVDDVISNINHLAHSERMTILWWVATMLGGYAVLESVAIYTRGVVTEMVSASMAFDIRQNLWRHLQGLSLSFHRSRPTGSLLSRLMSDISISQQMVNGGIVNVLIDAVAGLAAVAMLFSISWRLTIVVLLALPLYGVLYRRVNPRIRQVSQDVQEQTSVMSGAAIEKLGGMAVIQSFAQEPAEAEHFASYADGLRDLNIQRSKLNETLQSLSNFLITGGTAAVWVVAAYLAMSEEMAAGGGRVFTAGNVLMFTQIMALLYLPMRRFSEINIIYQTSMSAIERIFAIFDIMPDVRDKPSALVKMPGLGGIEFRNVSFHYAGGPMILRDLKLSIRPGERVALVGESGAGKSTLVTLIPRLYDVAEGSIRVDGIDVRDYKLASLRRSIGIVLQDTILFSGTIRENLRYGRKDAKEDEIISAAKAANAHEFIMRLPKGYDSVIGERGMTLSGGQRQRVSLARTILHNPRILILDEATSSLDSESENLIVDAMQRVMAGRTCLIIAHRLSTIMGADRIVVLKDGQVAEEGEHAELLGGRGHYRYLFEQQFGPLQNLLSRSRLG